MFIRVEDMRQYQINVRPLPTYIMIRGTNKEPVVRDHQCLQVPHIRKVLQTELIPSPKKFQNLPNADVTKYCHYHHNNGHTIEECDTLHDNTEELVCTSHLRHFVRNIEGGGPRPHYEEPKGWRCEWRNDQRGEHRELGREPRRNHNVERRRVSCHNVTSA